MLSALTLVASATVVSAQVPTLTHVKRIDLIPFLNTGASQLLTDSQPSDLAIASDGTIYVATQRSAGGAGTVGVLKIANAVGSHAVSLFATSTGAQGGDRESRVVVDGSNVYFGYGLGQNVGTDGAGAYTVGVNAGVLVSGVRKYSTAGVQDTGFGNIDPLDPETGTLNPVEIRYLQTGGVINPSQTQRTEAMAVDPLTSTLAIMNRGQGFMFRVNLATGASAAAANFATVASAGWRDLSFDASGNAYFKVDNQLAKSTRIDATNLSAYSPVLLDTGNVPFSSYTKVAYVPGGAGYADSLFMNTRGQIGATNQNKVYYSLTDGTPNAAAAFSNAAAGFLPTNQLTGAEPIGAVTPTAWTNPLLTTRTGNIGGKQYVAVLLGGGGQQLDIYEVSGPKATVSGTLNLDGWDGTGGGFANAGSFTVQVRNGMTVLDTQNVTVANNGAYSFQTTQTGSVNIRFKGPRFLAKASGTVTLTGGGTTTVNAAMVNGNVNGDNVVDFFDYLILSDAYESSTPDALYTANINADFTGDGTIDFFDYLILNANYEKEEDN
ncbi:MAG: hypothetical protein JNM85_11485 [Chthonomonas sp.]|nr:hypothetical protein [Chthonomonas sp.]